VSETESSETVNFRVGPLSRPNDTTVAHPCKNLICMIRFEGTAVIARQSANNCTGALSRLSRDKMMDVLTSVLSLLIVGYAGGVLSQLLRLPRIVCMILCGILLYPVIHPAVLDAALTVENPARNGAPIDVSGSIADGPNTAPYPALSPASEIRSMALLIALARGGLSVRVAYFKEFGVAMVALAVLPYVLEVLGELCGVAG
jgi:hypothetical protein